MVSYPRLVRFVCFQVAWCLQKEPTDRPTVDQVRMTCDIKFDPQLLQLACRFEHIHSSNQKAAKIRICGFKWHFTLHWTTTMFAFRIKANKSSSCGGFAGEGPIASVFTTCQKDDTARLCTRCLKIAGFRTCDGTMVPVSTILNVMARS